MIVYLKKIRTINCTVIIQLPERVANNNLGLFLPCIILWNDKSIKKINAVNQVYIKLF